jgi:hypothetical protein
MRGIARVHRPISDYRGLFERQIHNNQAEVFYWQGMFMKDFADSYTEKAEFSAYFPHYQMMRFEQLRTYFTWRTAVREGHVADISLSYAFLYIYELLNNIGAASPEDGLEKLASFWKAFSLHNSAIDRYLPRWLKDYYVYYNLAGHYPKTSETNDSFNSLCAVSKYDIKKSAFYTDENAKLIADCFNFAIDKIKLVFTQNNIHFDESIKQMTEWKPFKDALFHPWLELSSRQPDRRVVLSENEIYICNQNKWTHSTVVVTDSGRQLIGYIMKQTEVTLRKIFRYKYKLSADASTVLQYKLPLEKIVSDAVYEFHREANKIIVNVDNKALSTIRQEALLTQEKLIVPDVGEAVLSAPSVVDETIKEPIISSGWTGLKNALTAVEIGALSAPILKKYADEQGIMPEVLIDGINEKAMDFIGDNLMDDEFVIYDDYIEQIKELIK